MGGFGGLFAGLSRGFGGRLLQRSDEEREAARRRYEHEISMLEGVGLSPDADPQAAEAALRLASERHNAYLKSIGQKPKDIPDFYGTLADMMKGRGGTTAATTAGENPNQPSMDTGVPNLFSHQGDYMAQAAPAQGAAQGQTPAAQSGGYGIWRNPLDAKMAEVQAVGNYESQQKKKEMNERMAAIDVEVNAGRMTKEAGARAKVALQVGFPLPAERTAQPKYALFTNDRGDIQYIPAGSTIPVGYKPYEKGTAPRSRSFQARYGDKMAKLQASNPNISETEAHTQVMAQLEEEDKQKKAEKELDLQYKKLLIAAKAKALKDAKKKGGLSATAAAAGLRAARAESFNFEKQELANASESDPVKLAAKQRDIKMRSEERFREYVETVYGMTVEQMQALADKPEEGSENETTDPYIQQMTGMK